jgi:hypothetical protein
MRASSRGQTKKTNLRKERNFLRTEIPNPDHETFEQFQEAFRSLCRQLTRQSESERPPSEYLGNNGAISPRQANNILGRKQGVTLKVLWRLLRSEHGPRFHQAVLLNLRTAWAKDAYDQQTIAEKKKRLADLQRELKELEGSP